MRDEMVATLLVAFAVVTAGCASQVRRAPARAVASARPPATPVPSADAVPVARFATGTIDAAALEARAAGPLLAARQRVFEIETAILEGMVFDRLVEEAARARGLDPRAWVAAELEGELPTPDEGRVRELMAQYRAQLPPDEAEARAQVEAFLLDEARRARLDALKERLFTEAQVELLLAPPRAPVPLRAENPVRGAANAPVTIVEFSDFQCPYCRQVQPVLSKILNRYAGAVRLVFKHFPLASHPQAQAAAVAAACAAREGKFWELHDLLFQWQGELGPDELAALAGTVGLDPHRLSACQAAPELLAVVEADMAEGASLGIEATPRFFVNGRLLEGAQPEDAFIALIEDELRRERRAQPARERSGPARR